MPETENRETADYIDSFVEKVRKAQKTFEEFSQEQVDTVVASVANELRKHSEELAIHAHEETGFGRPEDKKIKNDIASIEIYEYIKDMKTVGFIRSLEEQRIAEIAAPIGIVLAIIPSTNPTSTTIYKALISLKSRNGIIFSPHPSAAECINYTAKLIHDVAVKAGAPENIVACVEKPTMEITSGLMKHRRTSIILATGGMGLVRAAYSAGKPAYGVGPGNVPAYIDRSADVEEAVRSVLVGKTFDWGTVCSSEQSIIVDEPIYKNVLDELKKRSAPLCSSEEVRLLEKTIVMDNLAVNPEIVGKSPVYIAEKAGFAVDPDTTALICPYEGIGKDYPLSIEKLSPVLTLYLAKNWRDGCSKCIEILHFGGLGHSLSIHCEDPDIIQQFALEKPASRILVNTSSTHGAVGQTTNLPPALTLGCGPLGGNITSDNITPLHLIAIKRLAYGVIPPDSTLPQLKLQPGATKPDTVSVLAEENSSVTSRENISLIVDEFLSGKSTPGRPMSRVAGSEETGNEQVEMEQKEKFEAPESTDISEDIADFVSEKDVQKALYSGRKILISKKTIITTLARELGDQHKIFKLS